MGQWKFAPRGLRVNSNIRLLAMRKRPLTAGDIRRAHARAVGRGGRKRCKRGKGCGAACIAGSKDCILLLPIPIQAPITKIRDILKKTVSKPTNRPLANVNKAGGGGSSESDYSQWKPVAQGNYGRVSVSPDGTRAVKELLTGPDGKKGEFGPNEVELARKMGELGHSPRVYKVTPNSMEMDIALGKPLWSGYSRGEDEPVMNATQATKAANAIKALHKLGYAHNDNHALQWMVNGNDVKLVDYGLSQPLSRGPVRAMQDLAKIAKLVVWDNPELSGNPYVQLVNKYLTPYREIKGVSKAAKAEKDRLAQAYLKELETLQ